MLKSITYEQNKTSDFIVNSLFQSKLKDVVQKAEINLLPDSKLGNLRTTSQVNKLGNVKFVSIMCSNLNKIWPDEISSDGKKLVFYGNERVLSGNGKSKKDINVFLRSIFKSLKNGDRNSITPIFVFEMDFEIQTLVFRGVAVPSSEPGILIEAKKQENGVALTNMVASFDIFGMESLPLLWINDLVENRRFTQNTPKEYSNWVNSLFFDQKIHNEALNDVDFKMKRNNESVFDNIESQLHQIIVSEKELSTKDMDCSVLLKDVSYDTNADLRLTNEYNDETFQNDKYMYDDYHEDQDSEIYHNEGTIKKIEVNKYERSSKARSFCIKYHGAFCHICGIDFGEMYGEIGEGFIHVHHLVPINEIGVNYEVNYKKDLIPVCPNCHAMLHRKIDGHLLSVDDLKLLLRKNNGEKTSKITT